MVSDPTRDSKVNPAKPWRSSKKIPAVTRVLEWTNLDTGVGAAIAAGSQELNGYWLLLVNAASNRDTHHTAEEPDCQIYLIANRYPISPIRLVIMVILAPDRLERDRLKATKKNLEIPRPSHPTKPTTMLPAYSKINILITNHSMLRWRIVDSGLLPI